MAARSVYRHGKVSVWALLSLLVASEAHAFQLNDSLKGSTQGNAVGGSIGPDGWTVTSNTDRLWYIVPVLASGSIEFKVSNITHNNLLLADVELFAMYDGGWGISEPVGYSPEFRDNFFKCMIRIYGQAEPSRLGQQKLMWGMCPGGSPGYGTCPCATKFFEEPFGGDPAWDGSPQTLRVEWGNGHARYLRNGSVVHDIDYSASGFSYTPGEQHFSLGTSRPSAVGSAGMPIGAIFSDVVVSGVEGQTWICNGSGGASGSGGSAGSSGGTTAEFSAQADSWTEPLAPSAAHGSDPDLRTGGDGRTIYLRFQVDGVSGSVSSARILMRAMNGGGGGEMHRVTDTSWSEATLTHANRPAVDPAVLSSVASVEIGASYEFDVTSAIAGNGLYSFAITSSVTDGSGYEAREAASGGPKLVIETSGSGAGGSTSSGGSGGVSGSGGSGWSGAPGNGGALASGGSSGGDAGDDGGCSTAAHSPKSDAGLLLLALALLVCRRKSRS